MSVTNNMPKKAPSGYNFFFFFGQIVYINTLVGDGKLLCTPGVP